MRHCGSSRFHFCEWQNDPSTGGIFVANSGNGAVSVLSRDRNHNLTLLETIELRMPIDNASIDDEGSIVAAGFSDVWVLVRSWDDVGAPMPSAVFRVRRREGGGRIWNIE